MRKQNAPTESSVKGETVRFRSPQITDASTLWEIVTASNVLDVNSCYAYLLLCRDFPETCLVAEVNGRIGGFVTAYIPPNKPEALFVWQVAVIPEMRGKRIARRLLEELLRRPVARTIRYLEATITPGNTASWRLFESVARERNAEMVRHAHFEQQHFPDSSHEEELLLRIGPL